MIFKTDIYKFLQQVSVASVNSSINKIELVLYFYQIKVI